MTQKQKDDQMLSLVRIVGKVEGALIVWKFGPRAGLDEALAELDQLVNEHNERFGEHDETDGTWPHGRCDTCGAPCDELGCSVDRNHVVALEG